MRKFQANFVKKIKPHILCSGIFFFENRAVYEIMWENIVMPERPQTTIRRVRISRWIPEVTNTHSEYVMFIFSTATTIA
jgi:hypothetical protein